MSGVVPQVCVLFGPSAAGGAYIPAFCDIVIMRDGNASMYLGSPRMAEMVIGEKVTLEEMGGARMHTGTSRLRRRARQDRRGGHRRRASATCRYLPGELGGRAAGRRRPPTPASRHADPRDRPGRREQAVRHDGWLIDALVDDGLVLRDPRALGQGADRRLRAHRRPRRRHRRQPAASRRAACCSSTRADKAARFIWTCNAFNIPLLFLADVPGFMIGTQVEKQGIIRHGAKMISAVSEATVPKLCVVVRKAYGAGLYAMAGPGVRARRDASRCRPRRSP